jgi:ABC-2 type transport system permease protein
MNPQPDVVPELPLEQQAGVPAAMARTRPFYWSVRRELWENRSVVVAPVVVGAVILIAFLVNAIYLAGRPGGVLELHIPNQPTPIEQPYAIAAILIALSGVLVGAFYSMEALHRERVDRSIVFWKSLPVSDLCTVLSKAAIPLLVLPLLMAAVIVVTHLGMLLLNSLVRLASGAGLAALRTQTPLFELWITLLYGVLVLALWHAPLYAWLLLVSGWARRAAFLWASLPLIAVCILEKIAFNTSYFASFLQDRFSGWWAAAFGYQRPCCVPHPLSTLTPGTLLSAPGLWIGLAIAAIFLAGAVRLRRCSGPI